MSTAEEIFEGARVKIDSEQSADTWLVTAVTGEGTDERLHLVHVNYSDVSRSVCRDRIRPAPVGR